MRFQVNNLISQVAGTGFNLNPEWFFVGVSGVEPIQSGTTDLQSVLIHRIKVLPCFAGDIGLEPMTLTLTVFRSNQLS